MESDLFLSVFFAFSSFRAFVINIFSSNSSRAIGFFDRDNDSDSNLDAFGRGNESSAARPPLPSFLRRQESRKKRDAWPPTAWAGINPCATWLPAPCDVVL